MTSYGYIIMIKVGLVWFDFIWIVSCSWSNHTILLLIFVAEKVLLLLVIPLTAKWYFVCMWDTVITHLSTMFYACYAYQLTSMCILYQQGPWYTTSMFLSFFIYFLIADWCPFTTACKLSVYLRFHMSFQCTNLNSSHINKCCLYICTN